jgi:hypothetical protein
MESVPPSEIKLIRFTFRLYYYLVDLTSIDTIFMITVGQKVCSGCELIKFNLSNASTTGLFCLKIGPPMCPYLLFMSLNNQVLSCKNCGNRKIGPPGDWSTYVNSHPLKSQFLQSYAFFYCVTDGSLINSHDLIIINLIH